MSGYPPDWDALRRQVYKRDNYECQNCGIKGGKNGSAELHAHHIVPLSSGGKNVVSNLTTLCRTCHGKIHPHMSSERNGEVSSARGSASSADLLPPDSSELFQDGELQDHNLAQSSFTEDDVGTSVTEFDLTNADTSNVQDMSGYPEDWDSRRRRVYRRDSYQCQKCNAEGGPRGDVELHAHHIIPKSQGGSHELSNLETLCKSCHASTHPHMDAPTDKSKSKSSTMPHNGPGPEWNSTKGLSQGTNRNISGGSSSSSRSNADSKSYSTSNGSSKDTSSNTSRSVSNANTNSKAYSTSNGSSKDTSSNTSRSVSNANTNSKAYSTSNVSSKDTSSNTSRSVSNANTNSKAYSTNNAKSIDTCNKPTSASFNASIRNNMNYPQSLADKVLFESELANPHVTGRPSSSDESNTSSNAHSTNNRENIDAHDESEAANSGGYANPLSNLLSFLGEFTGVMFSILLSFIISSVVAGIPAAAIGLLIEPLVKPIFGPDSVAVIALMGIFIFTGWMMIPKNESEFDEFGAWMNILTWLLVIISVCIGIIFIPVIMFLRA